LITDLVEHRVLFDDGRHQLADKWAETSEPPPIFKAIRLANKRGQYEAFVRFSVEIPGDAQSALWRDRSLQELWGRFYPMLQQGSDVCMVTGEIANIASNHPKNIRYPGDGAKLISSNDTEGFTYLGRFTSDKEACGVGVEVTQRAHGALRWLIERQGRRDGYQAIVAWAVSGAQVPDLMADTFLLLFGGEQETTPRKSGYTAQEIGSELSKLIAGYSTKLGSTEDVVVLGVDSATPGRMAIRFYRELTGAEFLDRVLAWHQGCSWLQRFGKDRVFVGAPSPRDIAEAAYGRRLDDTLRKATNERLLPCIVDGTPIPRDLVELCVRRASNRNGLESWEWEKTMGIACALYRHQNSERRYTMALERDRTTRDYLYGRLLALAEHLEGRALYVAGETRETNAGKLMQRFAQRPHSTWLTIETSLTPYKVRLRAKRPAFLHNVEQEIDDVIDTFVAGDFTSDQRLTGEFLLGYHCQRAALRPQSEQETTDAINTAD
jgi:CRISPR-associated protein Csd1